MEYLVIDVGGTAIKYACMNENAEFLERGEIPTPMDSLDSYLAALGTIIHRYGHNVEGIAMCVPGIIDSVQGVCITGGNLRYVKDLPLATLLEERYGLRVSLENDARCAALAELWRGSLKNCADGVVIVLGSAVGGALVKNGSIHKGSHFFQQERSVLSKKMGTFPTSATRSGIKMALYRCTGWWSNKRGFRRPSWTVYGSSRWRIAGMLACWKRLTVSPKVWHG